ncbi:hypothetical protein ACFFX1_11035 [Dactylosporangium sucinum]|uniref:Uncharacterized protein n=1 Tax=Dactylosporangium sucinum TaxID=1424081 RepID=A0A917WR33_9ACTN|nr:hypothetical protein [Dactylosporangium sucinum]GGM22597.1 hypothetical protein GCM10007977_024700 [Dactylosporangium sucinum]
MTYNDLARAVTNELGADDGDELAQAALQLALQAWHALADGDPAWDRFGLDLLDVRGRLHPNPTVAVVTPAPDRDRPELRAAVTTLVQALADRHERVAAGAERALAQRLQLDGAAVQLRRAAEALA